MFGCDVRMAPGGERVLGLHFRGKYSVSLQSHVLRRKKGGKMGSDKEAGVFLSAAFNVAPEGCDLALVGDYLA